MTEITLFGRPGCHLCDEVRDEILVLREQGYRFRLVEVDIESDEELLREHLVRIPVVEVDGEVVSELLLDRSALMARLDTWVR